jgi:hypothetical protein
VVISTHFDFFGKGLLVFSQLGKTLPFSKLEEGSETGDEWSMANGTGENC